MKYLKMFGLAVVAAAALTAFLGAGSASATVLCKTAVNPCPEGERWSTGTSLDATSTHITFYEANTCVASTLSAKTTSNGGSGVPVPLAIEGLSFSTCTKNTIVTTLGELQIEWINGTHDGIIKDRGTKGTVAVGLGTCGWNIGFGGAWVTVGRINGGSPATIELEAPVPAPEPLYVESA
jgi:hypothetical protein